MGQVGGVDRVLWARKLEEAGLEAASLELRALRPVLNASSGLFLQGTWGLPWSYQPRALWSPG